MSEAFFGYGQAEAQTNANALYGAQKKETVQPEVTLAKIFKDDLNVEINPQALRMFIRSRFDRLSPLAHKIHKAGT